MMHVSSADGTSLAYDRIGSGSPLVLIAGLFCDRRTLRPLADLLADDFDVIVYDRRGRGGSGDTSPYAVEREIEDLAALVDVLGGTSAVYGHSSGAGLALEAAAAGLPISRLVLHEPPYGGDDEVSRRESMALASAVATAIEQGRPADAVAAFFAASGMPAEMVTAMSEDPQMVAIAPSMPADLAVMGDGSIPLERVGRIRIPTLVVAGGASEDFFRDTATRLAEMIPDARLEILPGQDHSAPADQVAPAIRPFLHPA